MTMKYLLLILGMLVVTYIPRALPAVMMDKLHFGKRMNRFLELIPYTAMAALIFPGILSSDPEHMIVGIAGGLAAILVASKKMPVMIAVLAAIVTDMLLYVFVIH